MYKFNTIINFLNSHNFGKRLLYLGTEVVYYLVYKTLTNLINEKWKKVKFFLSICCWKLALTQLYQYLLTTRIKPVVDTSAICNNQLRRPAKFANYEVVWDGLSRIFCIVACLRIVLVLIWHTGKKNQLT